MTVLQVVAAAARCQPGRGAGVDENVVQRKPLNRLSVEETMKTLPILLLASLAVAAALPARANQELAQKKNCMACHAVDKKLVGPAYKEVAARYAGQKDAVDKLALKVMKGGSGTWGAIPMPANPQVDEAEAKQLVQWVLSLK
jgi:cytochrome c